MKLNAKSEYAVRAMVDLAQQGEAQTTVDEIAQRQQIPVAMLPGIIQSLAKAGLVETLRGHGGGVRLGQPAARVNVRMVLEAIDGPLHLHRCDTSIKGPCALGERGPCALKVLWGQTQERILEVWEQTSLVDLTENEKNARAELEAQRQPRAASARV